MKGMTIAAAIGLLFAVLVAGSPFLLFLGADPNSDTAGGAGFALMFVTIPMGAIVGLVSWIMLVVVSIIGVFRVRGESTVRLIITIAAPILLILPIGVLIWGFVNALSTEFANFHAATPTTWALIGAMILGGVVLAIISGLTSPPKNVALEGSTS
jgi:hypothetical protein